MRGADRERVTLELLGSPRVLLDGVPIQVDTRKAVALLAYLTVAGEERRRDSLAGLLWPDYEQSHARAALRRTLSTLNKALEGEGLVINRSSLAVQTSSVGVDVRTFRSLVAGCDIHRGRPSDRCRACYGNLSHAVELYRDDFMAGFSLRDCPEFDEWVFFEAEGLRRAMVGALQTLVTIARTAGDHDAGIAYARRWLNVDPLHEPAHQELMKLYANSGRRSDALRHYRDCVALLDRELGVAPLEETTELYLAIRDERYVMPPKQTTPLPDVRPQASRRGHFMQSSALPLVGRERELRAMNDAYQRIAATGTFIGIEGEAGVGKTRLVEDFLADVGAGGARIITAGGHEEEGGLAFGVVAELLREAVRQPDQAWLAEMPSTWLTEAARINPELSAEEPMPLAAPSLDSPGALARFLEGLAQVLAASLLGSAPGVLFVDDLQWVDESSLDSLGYTVGRLHRWPICVVAAWRSQDPSQAAGLRRLTAAAHRREGATFIRLSRLGAEEVGTLAAAAGLGSEQISTRLYRETEGLPLLVTEYLKALRDGVADEWSLPRSAREVLEARVGGVSAAAAQLLSAAAVLGKAFDLGMLRSVSGRTEEETVAGIDELVGRGVLVEAASAAREDATYGFSHDKLRAVVYESCTVARRRLLHRRAAESLLRYRAAEGSLAAIVANHFAEAGDQASAAHSFRMAGDYARRLHANVEALGHYETALGLGHPDVGALHMAIGDLQTLRGDYRAALESYEAAAARPEGTDIPLVEHKIGLVHHRRGDWVAAESYLESALKALQGPGDEARRARVMADLSLTAHRAGRSKEADRWGREALRLAAAAGDERALAQAHNLLGILANGRGDIESASEHLEKSLRLAESLEDGSASVAALNNLALTRRGAGELESARALAGRALDLCVAQGDRHREAALHNNLADILHAAGDTEGSMTHLKHAVQIFAEIGEAKEPQPEIWKLFEW